MDRMNPYDYYGDYLEEHTGVGRENVGLFKKGGMPKRNKKILDQLNQVQE